MRKKCTNLSIKGSRLEENVSVTETAREKEGAKERRMKDKLVFFI